VAAGAVLVQSCNVTGFNANGINLAVTAATMLSVTNSALIQNTLNGVATSAISNDLARFEIDHTRLENNGFAGLNSFQGSRGTIRDSFASGSSFGIAVQTMSPGQTSLLHIENCTATLNTDGIGAGGPSGSMETVRVSDTLIAHNTMTGVVSFDADAHIWSRSNNTVEDNTSNGTFTDFFSAK